ncbi:helix-turn-helix transcriptional regulator [Bauldia litoralis]|uniref:DNA-binding transcriptional regulator, CsgD family n=1 Tax=Bauldia litoralis TaxID=665467 RepID=A0A1G6BIM9_9HYPH|nr:hypothetical protein [Bauldia litoralis]SDB20437.1 DNA-binding transcriptional regulator, CsgD family [Bauldia litoralis]
MHLSEQTQRAIESCYDAILAPGRLPVALQILGESLGAESCTFATWDAVGDPHRMPRSDGHEDFAQLWIQNEPHAQDPHIVRGSAVNAGGAFVLEEHVSTEEERRTLPYYQETARAGNRDWWAVARFSVEGCSWCLPLYRAARRGPFTIEEARYFSAIGPHLARFVGIAEKISGFGVASELAALEQVRCAALVIDAVGIVRHLNPAAERLFGEDFYLSRGRPVAGGRVSNRRLQQLIALSQTAMRGGLPQHPPVVVDREGAPWLLVEAMPVTAFGSDFFSGGRTILLLTDLTSPQRPDAMLLSVAFGLTAAEAKLAAQLAAGTGIDTAAASLGVGRETARTQLKAIFAKTNTRRQAELAALVVRLRRPARS